MIAPPVAPTQDEIVRSFIHYSNEARDAMKWRKAWIASAPQMDFPTASLNEIISPMRPQEVTGIIARTGNGKTSFALALALYHARNLVATGRAKDNAIIYITWEQGVDELEMKADKNLGELGVHPSQIDAWRKELPFHYIGSSLERSNILGWNQPALTLDFVEQGVEKMCRELSEQGARVLMIIFDYVQLIPIKYQRTRTEEIAAAMQYIREIAQRFGTSAVVAVQASRKGDDRDSKMPQLNDAEHSASIEQGVHRLLAIMKPDIFYPLGYDLSFKSGSKVQVTHTLMLAQNLKDRGMAVGGRAQFHFNPETLTMGELA